MDTIDPLFLTETLVWLCYYHMSNQDILSEGATSEFRPRNQGSPLLGGGVPLSEKIS